MFSPARDISLITYPIIKGALDAAYNKQPELQEEFNKAAIILADYCNKIITDKRNIVEILRELKQKIVAELSEKVWNILTEELTYGFLLNFGEGAREATDSKVLLDRQVAALTEIGSVLSELDAEDRTKVIKMLKVAGAYEKELDRKPIVGKILTEIKTADDTTTNSQDIQ
jgi:hypothetical protein